MKCLAIIKKGMEFEDYSGDFRIVKIEGYYGGMFKCTYWDFKLDEDDEPTDELEKIGEGQLTSREIAHLANASGVQYED